MFIVKVPGINGLGKTKGCEKAGNAILECLRKEFWGNEEGKEVDTKILDLEEIHLDNSNLKLTNELIYKNSLEIFETKPRVIFLGGDHSISYSLTKAFLNYCSDEKKKPCLIVFDSHPDLMPVSEKKENYSNHEEWLRKLIEAGFPSGNILLVGIRNPAKEEISFIKEKKITSINLDNSLLDIENFCDTIMEFATGKELYISIDIDVIDPAFAPATGYPEPGGLTSRQFLYLIRRINRMKNLKAIDLVEINPEKDKDGLTVKLGAKILSELV
ncbi:N(1)-aminopropylagmatine ureohydrolase [uncultured archaeon]|nr:N(1)-aminopropylagmatine ureohydrolase [uncultured archaeon]